MEGQLYACLPDIETTRDPRRHLPVGRAYRHPKTVLAGEDLLGSAWNSRGRAEGSRYPGPVRHPTRRDKDRGAVGPAGGEIQERGLGADPFPEEIAAAAH